MRERIESALERLGHFVYRRAWWVIAGVLLAVGLAATQIPKIEIKASTDEFLRQGDEIKLRYDAFLEQFGRDDMMIVAIDPPEVFDLDFLAKLRSLHEELEDVPYVREVQSLVNARETRGVGDELIVGELLEEWPATATELADVRTRALANPLYTGLILSHDAGSTTLTLELEAFSDYYDSPDALAGFDDDETSAAEIAQAKRLSGTQELEAISAMNEILARYEADDFRVYAAGAPVMSVALMTSLVRDVLLFTVLSVVVIGFFLAAIFRRVLGIAAPLTVSILALVSTLGAMGALGLPAMPLSEVIPSFLLSVGVGGTVHLIVIFQQRIEGGASREDAIAGALGHSGLPIVMTSVTTAAGLASFATAALVPIAVFGTIAPLGILLTLVVTLILAPAILAVVPLRAKVRRRDYEPLSIRALTRVGDFATRHAFRVLVASSLLLLIAIVGIAQLRFSFNTLDWFPDDMPAKVASYKLDRDFGGAISLEILIETGQENGLHEPDLLAAIDRTRHTVRDLQVRDVVAGRSISIVDIVREIHGALNPQAGASALPGDRRLVSQELLLFENSGSDDLEDVVDTQFSTARFTIRAPFLDGSQYGPFADEVVRIFESELQGRARVSPTGLMIVAGRSFIAAIETVARAYVTALVVITPLMMLLLGSVRLGAIAMIPNLFPIALTLGLMGWLEIPLEMFSLLIGSIALGLAVDDTIHFMHGFRRHYAQDHDVPRAVRETLRTTGQALLFTSVVLSLGFAIYMFSMLNNLQTFGLLTAFAIVMAFAADVLLAPALMTYTARFSSVAGSTKQRAEAEAA